VQEIHIHPAYGRRVLKQALSDAGPAANVDTLIEATIAPGDRVIQLGDHLAHGILDQPVIEQLAALLADSRIRMAQSRPDRV
jgi:hypothetical protein